MSASAPPILNTPLNTKLLAEVTTVIASALVAADAGKSMCAFHSTWPWGIFISIFCALTVSRRARISAVVPTTSVPLPSADSVPLTLQPEAVEVYFVGRGNL